MSLLTRKPKQLTLEDRATNASIDADSALNIFSHTAQTLEASAIELENVAAEAANEASRLENLYGTALDEAHDRRAQATAIRRLVDGNLGGAK